MMIDGSIEVRMMICFTSTGKTYQEALLRASEQVSAAIVEMKRIVRL